MRGGAWNWVVAKEFGEGHQVQEEIASTKGKASHLGKRRTVSKMGEPRIRGGCGTGRGLGSRGSNTESIGRARGHERTQIPGTNAGSWGWGLRAHGSAPASDGVIVQVPENVPQDHAEDEQDSQGTEPKMALVTGRPGPTPVPPRRPRGPEGGTAARRCGCHLHPWRRRLTGRKGLGPRHPGAPAHLGAKACPVW